MGVQGIAEAWRTHQTGNVPRGVIHMQELVDQSEVADYAELARLAHVSRPRITQIMNLTLLAPDIQEAILFLPATDGGCGAIGERQVRRVCAVAGWRKQRRRWGEMVGS